jgi:hypothetical protein
VSALVLAPGKPRSPATARGAAVWMSRYDAEGVGVFCTNRVWAERLAAANRSSVRETSKLRLMGPGAVAWGAAVAVGAVLLMAGLADKGSARPSPSAKAPASRSVPAAPAGPRHR